ncbi:Crp/Fnr family transcriptional regulator [Bordetella trematum]|uniref:Crp/Fnr family transcriptional regulator n=1 Tax=Bordetella trematum TaxID=123899 RepID=UPI003AF3C996
MTIVNSPDPRVAEALRGHTWFKDVCPPALTRLAAASRWLRFSVGDTLVSEGQPATACLLVCEGLLQGLRYTAEGDEKVFGQVGPGNWLSVLTLFEPQPRHLHSALAKEAGAGCLIDGTALRQLCLADAALACRILTHGASLIHHHTDQIDWLTSSGAEQRLAEYILRAGRPLAAQPVHLPLNHAQIAVKLGMRAETLSRIFAKWRREGYIAQGRGDLCVLRLEALRRLAAGR